jgi:hypothetical protein
MPIEVGRWKMEEKKRKIEIAKGEEPEIVNREAVKEKTGFSQRPQRTLRENRGKRKIRSPGGFMRDLESTGIACLSVPSFSGKSGAKKESNLIELLSVSSVDSSDSASEEERARNRFFALRTALNALRFTIL